MFITPFMDLITAVFLNPWIVTQKWVAITPYY